MGKNMVNWYYVQGSERVGPVNEETLRDLYKKNVLNAESYIWRKGFANWERLKDVTEIDFSKPSVPPAPLKKVVLEEAPKEEEQVISTGPSSPEIIFNFDWNSVGEDEELFYLKIGRDRAMKSAASTYGPYSIKELKAALDDKRINNKTLLYSAGMSGWIELGQTPLDPKILKINMSETIGETPLLMVLENEPLPLIALVKEAGATRCTLLGAGPFKAGTTLLSSLYSGTQLKAKDVKLEIEKYDPKDQMVSCHILEIDEGAKKIIQNYAN